MTDSDKPEATTSHENRLTDGIDTIIREAPEGEETAVDVIRDVIVGVGGDPDTKAATLLISRRKLNPEPPAAPDRSESPRRAHMFNDVGGFGAYLDKYGEDDVVVLANIAAGQMTAVLDEKADKGFEVISFKPLEHPLLTPWADAIDDGPMLIADFVQFVAENRRTVVEPEAANLIAMLSVIGAGTTITLNRTAQGAAGLNGLMIETKLQGQDSAQTPVSIPPIIKIRCPVFMKTMARYIEIDLTVFPVKNGTEVFVRMTSADRTVASIEAFEQMIHDLADGQDNKRVVALGCTHTKPWDYLGED